MTPCDVTIYETAWKCLSKFLERVLRFLPIFSFDGDTGILEWATYMVRESIDCLQCEGFGGLQIALLNQSISAKSVTFHDARKPLP